MKEAAPLPWPPQDWKEMFWGASGWQVPFSFFILGRRDVRREEDGFFLLSFSQEAVLYSPILLSVSIGPFGVLTLSVMGLQPSQPVHCAIVISQWGLSFREASF